MNKILKKRVSLLLAITLVITALAVGLTAFGDSMVAINQTNFPDPVFRRVVAEKYDANEDGYLSESERNVTLFSISGLIENSDFDKATEKCFDAITEIEYILDSEKLSLENLF